MPILAVFVYLMIQKTGSMPTSTRMAQSSEGSSVEGKAKPWNQVPKVEPDSRDFDQTPVLAPASAGILDDIKASLDQSRDSDFIGFLTTLGSSPERRSDDEVIRAALKKWAGFDGVSAAKWAKARQACRRYLPEILRAWANIGGDSAVAAWKLAKEESAKDRDEASWLSEEFVATAFREISAVIGEDVWSEMAALSGQASVAAMIGMADFASNRQTNTAFASAMEERVLNYESPAMAAAFYAGAGHITAAKAELATVTDQSQWHTIAREIARQQAVIEPAEAILWLQSQFKNPTDAILDMVRSIGMMHALNAGDVLQWLVDLPESEARAAGLGQIRNAFPDLKIGGE